MGLIIEIYCPSWYFKNVFFVFFCKTMYGRRVVATLLESTSSCVFVVLRQDISHDLEAQ